ncbi:hypothetical protein [Microcoleus sp. FACHB-68]|uniref:hypothetical protein n=1 Tax=Microcoleus sp. FACHB-68 TaxID=2692826 RepID=UPI0016891E17|nr:hypothetical protein [Microcoleus sp. FACHB-68]MBD1937151.1 hypothetical protein [Microcoleus sp. FACHB-68]
MGLGGCRHQVACEGGLLLKNLSLLRGVLYSQLQLNNTANIYTSLKVTRLPVLIRLRCH